MSEQINDRDETRIENLMNGTGISYAEAEARITGLPERSLGRTAISPQPERSHTSRRGGRSFNEGSDSEHDPYWNVQPSQTPEDPQSRIGRESNQSGSYRLTDQRRIAGGLPQNHAAALRRAKDERGR